MKAPPTCRDCRHFVADPVELERLLVGVCILSSTSGSSRGDAGICAVTGRLHDPLTACDEFSGHGADGPRPVASASE